MANSMAEGFKDWKQLDKWFCTNMCLINV